MSQYSQMTDSQLKQTISQLHSSAGATPKFPTWQNQMAPATPGSSSWQPPKPVTRTRSRPNRTGTSTPVATSSYAQPNAPGYQQPAVAPPVIAPQVPTHSTAIPSVAQALHSSYASRLRTGATLLVQPIIAAPVTALTSSTMKIGRAGKRINYAEAGSGDEDMEVDIEGKEGSDESDYGGAKRAGSKALGTHHTPQPQQLQRAGLDQSYLGMIPPSRFIPLKVAHMTRHEYFAADALQGQARKPTNLIPIRVELETETHRIRDAFVWNLNEQLISPSTFAKIFCADLDLPIVPYAEQVEGAIRAQIEEWEGVASMDLRPPLPQPKTNEDPAPFFSVTNLDPGEPKIEEWELLGEEYRAVAGEEVPDCRVILEIDVQIATQHLSDHIEWDLLSPLTPEEFARTLCCDLGLGGESIPLIAHAVHEEILRHKRDAIEWNVISVGEASTGDGEEEREKPRDRSGMSLLKDKTGLGMGSGFGRRGEGRGPRPLKSVFRDWSDMEEWGTKLEELTAEEVERREIERERAARRLRRETSRFQQTTSTVRFRRR
ncbi:hypothetical protein M422DRAFT_241501 [Sphaerobolus stellatus SS14]|nr:hypothetical protein M422DRAFT_241501 [Sphaerobolus stellatus SS14]